MVAIAVGFRDDGPLRHYKYTWAAAGAALLVVTFLFGTEVNGARLWLHLGPVGFQPGEAIKIVLVVFIAGYLAENRALLAGAHRRIGPVKIPPLPYFLPMLAIFGIVMGIVVISNDLGTALLFYGIFLTMLFVATGRRSYVLVGLVLFLAGSFVAYQLFGHVRIRVDNWIDPWADPSGDGVPDGPGHLCLRAGRSLRRGPGPGPAADLRATCRSRRSRRTSSSPRSPRSLAWSAPSGCWRSWQRWYSGACASPSSLVTTSAASLPSGWSAASACRR